MTDDRTKALQRHLAQIVAERSATITHPPAIPGQTFDDITIVADPTVPPRTIILRSAAEERHITNIGDPEA